ncbi:acetate--CoA ligase family protein [Desulfobacterota bacterium M19]
MLTALFTPQAIAVVGASRRPGKFGNVILRNLMEGGFAGKIVPVNPRAGEIMGLPCFSSLRQVRDKIDLSVIIVSQPQVLQAVHDSIAAGARALIVNSTGFKEVDARGAELEEKIAEICTLRQISLLGPNCLGLINTGHRLNILHGAAMPGEGGISMLSQSSAICAAFLEGMAASGLGVAKVVSLGNKAQLTEVDMLRALGRDEDSKLIAAYLENIASGDDFVKAAEGASNKKPVIILKSAVTQAGRRAAAAHSGELISDDTAYGAAFKRAGIIRAESFSAFLDYTLAFSLQPLPAGRRVLVITNAGGPGIMAVDSLVRAGLRPAYIEASRALELEAGLPAAATVYNPLDLLADAGPERYEIAIKTALASSNVDALLVIMADRGNDKPRETALAVVGAARGDKPLLVSFLGGHKKEISRLLRQGGIPAYNSSEQAVSVMAAMCDYQAWRQRPARVVTRFPVNRRRVERIIARRLRAGRFVIAEGRAKDILRAYDFQIPEGCLTLNADEAVEAARRLGYPVALKISSPDIIHKEECGGLRLGLSNRQEVLDACDLLLLRVRQQVPEARQVGVYVEKMQEPGLEIIVGMHRDPQFGPLLMFGLGGVFMEVLKDVAFYLAPITFDEAMQMLTSTKSYQSILNGRSRKGLDFAAVARVLQKISQLATDFPEISDLEINPLMINESCSEPMVINAGITLKKQVSAP